MWRSLHLLNYNFHYFKIVDCKIEYQGASDTWGDGSCTPGEVKPNTCTGCACGDDASGIFNWCNENKLWVHACRINVCKGNTINMQLIKTLTS